MTLQIALNKVVIMKKLMVFQNAKKYMPYRYFIAFLDTNNTRQISPQYQMPDQ